MKAWEIDVLKSRLNLWLVTVGIDKFLCVKIGNDFFIKASRLLLIDQSKIVNSEKI